MKILVCVTKSAEIEVDLDIAREFLIQRGREYEAWADDWIAETYVGYVLEDLDPEFDQIIVAVSLINEPFPEAA